MSVVTEREAAGRACPFQNRHCIGSACHLWNAAESEWKERTTLDDEMVKRWANWHGNRRNLMLRASEHEADKGTVSAWWQPIWECERHLADTGWHRLLSEYWGDANYGRGEIKRGDCGARATKTVAHI